MNKNDNKLMVPVDKVRGYNCVKQHLVPGFQAKSISEVAQNLCGLHAARLSSPFVISHARLNNFHTADLHSQLYKKNNLIKLRCMRTTLHVVPLNTAPIFHQATLAMRLQKCLLLYKKLNINLNDIGELKEVIEKSIYKKSMSAENIIDLFIAQPKKFRNLERTKWKELIKTIIKHLWEEGTICYVNASLSWESESRLYAHTRKKYPNLNLGNINQIEAIKLLIKYHIENFGPVSRKDIAWWSGLALRDIDVAINSLQDILTTCNILGSDNTVFYILKENLNNLLKYDTKEFKWINLLAHEDSSLKGYFESRWRYVDDKYYGRLFNQIGEARASIMINGKIMGLWFWNKKNQKISYELFENIGNNQLNQLEKKIHNLEECLIEEWTDEIVR